MAKRLPKGHLSCLSSAFRYTPSVDTNIANTFARIARELKARDAAAAAAMAPIRSFPVVIHRPFPRETIESAWRLLRAGGFEARAAIAR
jgi:hypothetical protein